MLRVAQTVQSRRRQQHGVYFVAPFQALQARGHVAAQRDDFQVGAQVQQLCLAARRTGSNCARRVSSRPAARRTARRAGLRGSGTAPKIKPVGQGRGHVFQRVDGQVNRAVEQIPFQLFGKHAGRAQMPQAGHSVPVALRGHNAQTDFEAGVRLSQAVPQSPAPAFSQAGWPVTQYYILRSSIKTAPRTCWC